MYAAPARRRTRIKTARARSTSNKANPGRLPASASREGLRWFYSQQTRPNQRQATGYSPRLGWKRLRLSWKQLKQVGWFSLFREHRAASSFCCSTKWQLKLEVCINSSQNFPTGQFTNYSSKMKPVFFVNPTQTIHWLALDLYQLLLIQRSPTRQDGQMLDVGSVPSLPLAPPFEKFQAPQLSENSKSGWEVLRCFKNDVFVPFFPSILGVKHHIFKSLFYKPTCLGWCSSLSTVFQTVKPLRGDSFMSKVFCVACRWNGKTSQQPPFGLKVFNHFGGQIRQPTLLLTIDVSWWNLIQLLKVLHWCCCCLNSRRYPLPGRERPYIT